MRSRQRKLTSFTASFCAILCWSAPCVGVDEADRLSTGHELNKEVKPEHRVRPLPTDTFKPTEEVSEDFPVPFPTDI